MIVITLTKVPNSLRGDLTKWCQEIQTGVYVGNPSAKVRDLLWKRIEKNIGNGEATLVYNTNNELGYTFLTTRRDYDVVYLDGLPFMKQLNVPMGQVKHGFSNAAKNHKARVMRNRVNNNVSKIVKPSKTIVSIDLETTGIKPETSEIISIGAVKHIGDKDITFSRYVKINSHVPDEISKLTGINNDLLANKGVSLIEALDDFVNFLGDGIIVGYNVKFDEKFLKHAFSTLDKPMLLNKFIDLMPYAKKEDRFLENYRLETVLKKFDIVNDRPHDSLFDARATMNLADKLIKKGILRI